MTSMDAKLFTWQRLQVQYDIARSRLFQVARTQASEDELHVLRTEVTRLEDAIVRSSQEIDALRKADAARAPSPP